MSTSNTTEYINTFSVTIKLKGEDTTVDVGQTIPTTTFVGRTPEEDAKEQLEAFGESLTAKSYITGFDILGIASENNDYIEAGLAAARAVNCKIDRAIESGQSFTCHIGGVNDQVTAPGGYLYIEDDDTDENNPRLEYLVRSDLRPYLENALATTRMPPGVTVSRHNDNILRFVGDNSRAPLEQAKAVMFTACVNFQKNRYDPQRTCY